MRFCTLKISVFPVDREEQKGLRPSRELRQKFCYPGTD
jgi:hypothetical protein